jgi:hypothetical protein
LWKTPDLCLAARLSADEIALVTAGESGCN